jgi:ElaB/YqjD/DUF883 family membrane-anchored ribosome-binding protein
MADTTKTTQEAGRTTGGQSTAGQSTATSRSPQSNEQTSGKQETGHSSTPGSQQTYATKTSDSSSSAQRDLKEKSGEMIDQAGQAVSEAYQRATQTVNEKLGQAKEYSRENPGTATMVAFGVGVGVGVLLASGLLNTGRSRSQRIVPPVMNALSEIASELLRR